MTRQKKVILNLVALFIIFGSLCSSLFILPDSTTLVAQREALPSRCLDSFSSEDEAAGGKTDYFCASASYRTFAFQVSAVSSGANNFFQSGLSLIRPIPADSSHTGALAGKLFYFSYPYPGQNVSARFVNSVLNL